MRRLAATLLLLTAAAFACTDEILQPRGHAKDFDLHGPVREVRITLAEPNGDHFVNRNILLRFVRQGRALYDDNGERVVQYRYDRSGRLILRLEQDEQGHIDEYELHEFVAPDREHITRVSGEKTLETRTYKHGRLVEELLEQEN